MLPGKNARCITLLTPHGWGRDRTDLRGIRVRCILRRPAGFCHAHIPPCSSSTTCRQSPCSLQSSLSVTLPLQFFPFCSHHTLRVLTLPLGSGLAILGLVKKLFFPVATLTTTTSISEIIQSGEHLLVLGAQRLVQVGELIPSTTFMRWRCGLAFAGWS